MSDIPRPCQCGDPFHGGTCFHCGCSCYCEDDGTDGPTVYRYPDCNADPYQGWYLGKKYSLTQREDEAS